MSSTQKRAILQVRIREEDKQNAERLYDAMGTSLAEAVRLFVAQSIMMRKLPFQPVAVRSKDGTAAYGSLKAYGDPNRRSEERNAWIEYLATESDDSILGPEEVDIHEWHHHRRDRHPTLPARRRRGPVTARRKGHRHAHRTCLPRNHHARRGHAARRL